MKKFFLFVAGLALLSAVIGCFLGVSAKGMTGFFGRRSITGSGTIVTRTVKVGQFDAVQVSRAIRADILAAKAGEIIVRADDNLSDLVVVKVEEGTLKIGIDKSVQNICDHHIRVTVPYDERIGSLKASSAATIVCKEPLRAPKTELKASSSADIEAAVGNAEECECTASSAATIKATIKASECEFKASSSADIEADVTADQVEVKASSAADIALTGSARACEAELSSAAKFSARKFDVQLYDVEASSGSDAFVRCNGLLKAQASSGATIRYTGDCQTRTSESSGGSIRNK